MLQPVILSGGSGSRLWPLSREQYPKQLLPLVSEQTLLQATAKRLDGYAGVVAAPLVVCNEEHRFIAVDQLREAGCPAQRLILEPAGRNTAPALTLVALFAAAGEADPILLVMPADHVVTDTSAFHLALAEATVLADAGRIVTFGIVPAWSETGYGYIRGAGPDGDGVARRVAAFVEKPDAETARRYVESREYYWNSGIFVLRASVWLTALHRFRPDILDSCRRAMVGETNDGEFVRVDRAAFLACPSESIDYAVMERVPKEPASELAVSVIPISAGWSDVGAWDALWEVCEKDAGDNVVRGDVLMHDAVGCLVIAESRLVACIGLRDVVVVETPDAIMVVDRDRTQDVKTMVERLKADGRSEFRAHRKIHRPWGFYDSVDNGDRFQVKRIVVNPGARLSQQMHHHRAEHWIVVKGTASVTRGDETFLLSENQSTYIPLGVTHRLENPGKLPLEMIEVQSGAYLAEDDIVRFDDHYGRS
jgi:mannose-1-phosphate guanylyltransferase/mannose-6-phosphate isomerase